MCECLKSHTFILLIRERVFLRVAGHRNQDVCFVFKFVFKLAGNAVKCHCVIVCSQVEREGMCGIFLPLELIDVPIGPVKASNKRCAYF